MTHKNSTTQSGFTLLELLLVIGVAALLLIGGIATYRLVSDGNKATEATRLLLTIRQQSQVLAQQQGGAYTGIQFNSTDATDTALTTSGVLRIGQRNPFGGEIVVAPTGDNLVVTFGNISQSACVKLVQAINNENEAVSVEVNTGSPITTFPITAGAASTACAESTNTITWTLI